MSELTRYAEQIMPEGWEVADDAVLVAPDGCCIEWDGECPDGYVSPLKTMGLI